MKPTRHAVRGEKWCVFDGYGATDRRTYRKHERALRKREARAEMREG